MSSISTDTENAANAASARAISREPALCTQPVDTALAVQLGLQVPKPGILQSQNETVLARGISDAIAVVAAHHDEHIHAQFKARDPLVNLLFNEMERLRCEAIGTTHRAGIASNLNTLWETTAHQPHPEEHKQLRLVFSYLTKKALRQKATCTDAMQQVFAKWQDALATSTDPLWSDLEKTKTDQLMYAEVALQIIATLNIDTRSAMSDAASTTAIQSEDDQKPTDQESEETDQDNDADLSNTERPDEDNQDQDALIVESNEADYDEDFTKNKDAPVDAESEIGSGTLVQSVATYQCYSNSFDEIIHAKSLCDAAETKALRQLLDEHIDRHKKVVAKLSGQLQRMLMAQQNRHWKFDREEGLLDTARLTRIVTQPYSGLSFKEESMLDFRDTVVTLLVDNSKSMLGKPIAIAASCADILAQTLERCGVSVEILGFTTTELHGGELFNLWKQQGKSQDPGRLNGLRHVIYKSADVPYRRAREGFGLMLHNDLLKQNIDGEALLWANERLQRRPEERKILLVISDGAPIDTSTMTANRDNYLIDHLHQVIQRLEQNSSLQLAAIGIGHDVSSYYKNAITISDARALGETLLTQLRTLFTQPGHRTPKH